MNERASLTRRPALRGAAALPEVEIYGGAALAAVAALVVGTAGGHAIRLTLGMLLVAASVALVLVGSVRVQRLDSARRADIESAGTPGCANDESSKPSR